MNIALAKRVQKVKPSPTLAVAAKATQMRAQGLDIINLGTGEPDFDTPQHIKLAAIQAIESGYTKYTAVDGIPELKEAIKNKFKADNGLDYELNQILVSVGGKQSCYNLCQAFLNSGDEVIIPAPYWVSYPDMVLLADATPVIISTTPAQRYKISAQQLEQAITPKTKMIFLNSPSNPSGVAYTLEELKALGAVLKKHPQVLIATDDMYEHIIWSQPFCNILNACPELYDQTIVLNGVSKAYAMTGWRIGYAGGPKAIIAAMKKIQSQSTSNPSSISQAASVAALSGDQTCVREMTRAFKERHDYVVAALNGIPGFKCLPSAGTFYAFPNVTEALRAKGLKDDLALSELLLNSGEVAVVPGSAFGAPGYLRLSFACSLDTLKEAIGRITRVIG